MFQNLLHLHHSFFVQEFLLSLQKNFLKLCLHWFPLISTHKTPSFLISWPFQIISSSGFWIVLKKILLFFIFSNVLYIDGSDITPWGDWLWIVCEASWVFSIASWVSVSFSRFDSLKTFSIFIVGSFTSVYFLVMSSKLSANFLIKKCS